MSVKNNGFVAATLLALGIPEADAGTPVAEAMLNDKQIGGLYAAEVSNGSGRVIVFAGVPDGSGGYKSRPVADALGNVRLFKDGSAVVALSKKTTLIAGGPVVFMKAEKMASVGDPVASLKAKFKKIKAEKAVTVLRVADLESKRLAAVSQGWDTAGNTPEGVEYADILARIATVAEWAASCVTIFDNLSAALTAAGVDPATVV